MKNYISRFRESEKLNRILYWTILILSFAYIFSIPSFSSRTLFNIISYLLVGSLGVATFLFTFLYAKFLFHKELLFVPAFALFSFLGTVIYTRDFRMWLSIVMLTITFLVFYYVFQIVNKKTIILEIICNAISLFALYFVITYAKEIIESFSGQSVRLGSKFANVDAVSAVCAIGFASSLYLLFFLRTRYKYFHIINLVLIALVGISTISRTFIFAVLVFTLIFLFAKFKRRKPLFFVVVMSIVVFSTVLLSFPFMEGVRTRLLNAIKTIGGSAEKADTSVLERSAWLEYGFYLGMKNLLIGYGANGFSVVSGVGTYTHSNFSEVICDFGLIGLLLFYLPIFLCTFRCIANKNVNSFFVFGFLTYYLVVSFSNVFYYNKNYYILLALIYYLSFDYKSVSIPVKNIMVVYDGNDTDTFKSCIMQIKNLLTDTVGFGIYDMNAKCYYKCADFLKDRYNCKNTVLTNVSYINILRKTRPDILIALSFEANKFAIKRLFLSNSKRLYFINNSKLFCKLNSNLLNKVCSYFNDGFIFSNSQSMDNVSRSVLKRSYFIDNCSGFNNIVDSFSCYLDSINNADLVL